MVGSPRFQMRGQCSGVKKSGASKKPSPKCSGAKRSGASPRVVKKRADWNPGLEKSLVDILLEYKESGHRGDNGWNSEGWNRMVKEFHVRNKYVSFTKQQIQDKEDQLKKDYKMLRAAKEQSGSSWNEKRNMVEGPPALWDNLMVSFPKIKKFNNSKASFPLFDALGELYDGHLAQGTYNVTSIEALEDGEPPEQLEDVEDEPLLVAEQEHPEQLHDALAQRNEEVLEGSADILSRGEQSDEAPTVERSGQRRRAAASKKQEKVPKRPRKNEEIVGIMGAYLEMRTKESEAEVADRAREREAREREVRQREEREAREREEREARQREARQKDVAQGSDFSITRCISVLNRMEMTKEEKAKAYAVFIKSKDNREAFISASEFDQETSLIWLRSEMA
ncbi:unnamed protein product [Urochloa humidicola]